MRMRSATIAVACFSILLTSPAVLADPKPTATEVIIATLRPLPFDLKGYLRRPTGAGRLPAAVLLPGCDQLLGPVDQDWGEQISSWGYVALTLDSFSSRGIRNTCAQRAPLALAADAYQALAFLSRQTFVDAENVFLVGFSQGGTLTLFAVERGGIELSSKLKFRAAVAFYPFCESSTGRLTIPTLIVIARGRSWPISEVGQCPLLRRSWGTSGHRLMKCNPLDGMALRLAVEGRAQS